MGIEQIGKRVLRRYKVVVPQVLAVGITVPLQMWLAHLLFFPPCTDADMTDKLLGSLLRDYKIVRRLFTSSGWSL